MKYIFCAGFALILLFAANLAMADSQSTPPEVLERILKNTEQMQGEFTQLVISEGGQRTAPASGQFWINKPGQFRWNYLKPYVQNIVSDGTTIWFYDQDLEQVTIKPALQQDQVSPLSIIGGDQPLAEMFMVQHKGKIDTIDWLELFPIGEDSSYSSIHVGIHEGKLVRMILNDQFGQSTRLLFSGVDTETPIEPARFEFKVPEGVDVFQEN